MSKKLILGLCWLVLLVSCQEEVRLELLNSDKTPIIEAIWTDKSSSNHVTLSFSRNYYDTLQNEVISDATVRIYDETNGDQIDFRYLENLGRYLPINNQKAIIGHDYRLEVIIGEQIYSSAGTTLEPPVLDSITYEFVEERFFRDEGYYLTLYGKIPFEENNNYRLKITKNDTLLNRRSDYFLFDDTFGTAILNSGFELDGFAFEDGDKIKLELHRMNQSAFDYLNQMVGLLFNDGGLFSPPPENPNTNIRVMNGTGMVLGYFMTGPAVIKTVNIEGSE